MSYDPPLWGDKRSYDEGFDDGQDTLVERIRSAIRQRCGRGRITLGGNPYTCGLNRGHIGDCSPFTGDITITKDRLEEILNG